MIFDMVLLKFRHDFRHGFDMIFDIVFWRKINKKNRLVVEIQGEHKHKQRERERESKGGQQEENWERSDRREASNWSFLERGFNRSSIGATPVRLRLTLLSLITSRWYLWFFEQSWLVD